MDSVQFEDHGSVDEVISHPTEFLDPEQNHKKMDREKNSKKMGRKKTARIKKKLFKKMLHKNAPHLAFSLFLHPNPPPFLQIPLSQQIRQDW